MTWSRSLTSCSGRNGTTGGRSGHAGSYVDCTAKVHIPCRTRYWADLQAVAVNPSVNLVVGIRWHQIGRPLDLSCTDGLGQTPRTVVRRLVSGRLGVRVPPPAPISPAQGP